MKKIQVIKSFSKLFLLTLILNINFFNSIQLFERFTNSLLLSNKQLFLVTENGFRLYNENLDELKNHYDFTSYERRIKSDNEQDTICLAEYEDGIIIALVNNYIYAFDQNGDYISDYNLNGYLMANPQSYYYYSLIPFKLNDNRYFVISFNDNTQIALIKFSFTNPVNEPFTLKYKIYKNEEKRVTSYGINCIKFDTEVSNLVCSYQIEYSYELGISFYSVTESSIEELTNKTTSTPINQASIIKVVLTANKEELFICYSHFFEYVKCLRYKFINNSFTDEEQILSTCKGRVTGLNFYYFENKNEYMFITKNTNSNSGFSVVLFNSTYHIQNSNSEGNLTSFYKYKDKCYDIYNFNVIYSDNNMDYIIINDCDIGSGKFGSINVGFNELSTNNYTFPNFETVDYFYNYTFLQENLTDSLTNINTESLQTESPTDEIIETDMTTEAVTNVITDSVAETSFQSTDILTDSVTETSIQSTDIQTDSITPTSIQSTDMAEPTYKENNNNTIVVYSTIKTKDEIINDLDDLIKDKDPEETYIINGNDFAVIIKPVNGYVEESTVNIDFSECEKKLKEKYPSKEFRILQVNMENKNENCLTDQVEYKIYDELGEEMDLSLCSDVDIIIEYEIKNTSLLNLEQIASFKDQGIDIFNLKHDFFNDICYSYSDGNSSSDMILNDRVADIYQNFSICGEECEYESFNAEKLSANCNCKVKQEVSTEVEQGNFETYITSAFLDSNFGVVKCYNLVFSLKGKLKNAGFWIFGIMIIIHIPVYIFHFINGVNPLLKYISREMDKKGYSVNNEKEKHKHKHIHSPRIQTTNEDLKESPALKFKKNTKNPPKKSNYLSSFIFKSNKTKKKEKHIEDDKSIKTNPKLKNKKSSKKTLENNMNAQNEDKKNKNKIKFTDIDVELTNNDDNNNLENNKNTVNKKYSNKLVFSNNTSNIFNTIETNLNSPKKESNKNNNDELVLDLNYNKDNGEPKKHSKKNLRKFHRNKKSNNLISELESGDFLTQNDEYKKQLNKKIKSPKKVKFSNKNITKNIKPTEVGEKFVRSSKKLKTEFPLILINANNKKDDNALKSNYILNNFDFEQAVNYDKRPFCRIFYIYLISKENNLNIIFFNPPLELKPIRICVFIFTYACDFALNALFYLSDNISDKYHYSGAYRELYTLVNNLTISISSTLVSFLLLYFFQTLTQSSGKIEDLFRKQELLLKTDKNYKVTENTKKEIQKKIDSILRCLKIKIICFIILEIIFMLFFFYYATAFCQVYQSTQVSWILDCLSSYAISLVITFVLSFVCAICYIASLKYKIKIMYKIITFIYTFS